LSEIRGYTLGQFQAFSRAASRQHRQQMRDAAVNLRAAQYEKKDFVKYLKQLDPDDGTD
jgi:hypothetical protein